MSACQTLYFDAQHGLAAAKILPGEYHATGEDMLLVTVLGSCVALCLRDAVSGVGLSLIHISEPTRH